MIDIAALSTPELDRLWLLDRLAEEPIPLRVFASPDVGVLLNAHPPPSGRRAIPTVVASAWRDDLIEFHIDGRRMAPLEVDDIHALFDTPDRFVRMGLTDGGYRQWKQAFGGRQTSLDGPPGNLVPGYLGFDDTRATDLADQGWVPADSESFPNAWMVSAKLYEDILQVRLRAPGRRERVFGAACVHQTEAHRLLELGKARILRLRRYPTSIEFHLVPGPATTLDTFELVRIRTAAVRWWRRPMEVGEPEDVPDMARVRDALEGALDAIRPDMPIEVRRVGDGGIRVQPGGLLLRRATDWAKLLRILRAIRKLADDDTRWEQATQVLAHHASASPCPDVQKQDADRQNARLRVERAIAPGPVQPRAAGTPHS